MSITRQAARRETAERKKRIGEQVGKNRANLIISFEDVIAKGLKGDPTGREVMQCLTAALTGFVRSRPASEHVQHVNYVGGKLLALVPHTAPPEVQEAIRKAEAGESEAAAEDPQDASAEAAE
jgi:hypothetical protein